MKKITAIVLSAIMIFTATLTFSAKAAGPSVSAGAYAVINAATGQTLCGQNTEKEVDPSGLTSLAVAYLYITKTPDLDKEITVNFSASDADVPGSVSDMLGLKKGDKVKASDLLAAVFAKGYPDAVKALAADMFPENYAAAVDEINALFANSGFDHTNFKNIYGDYDYEHYISVKEYAAFTAEALKNETFRRYFETPAESIEISGKTKKITSSYMQFDGKQFKYENAVGGLDVKHLSSSSRSLVSVAEKDGIMLIAVIVNASSEEKLYDGAENLFEYGYNDFSYVSLSPSEIPTKEIETTEGKEFARVFCGQTIDIYLNNNISTENLFYHIDIPDDFGKDNPTAYLEITQSRSDLQYEEIGKYPLTVKFETYNSLVPTENANQSKGLSAADVIIIVVIVLLLAAIGIIFWLLFQKKKTNQRRARYRKMEKLQSRSLNPKDIREREEKENLRKGISSVASEVENYGINEDYIEPPVIVRTERTGTRETIEAAKEESKKKREAEIREFERRIEQEGRRERAGRQNLDRTYVTAEDGRRMSPEELREYSRRRAEESRRENESSTFEKRVFGEDGRTLKKEEIEELSVHEKKEKSLPRTGTAESLTEAKRRNAEARESGNKKTVRERTVITSESGKTIDRKAVDSLNDSSRQKKETLERTRLMNAERRKARPGELVIKEIQNPDGSVTKILAPDGDE